MITYEEALKKINQNLPGLKVQRRHVPECLGYVLAEEITSNISLPPMDNSAMDGFLIRSSDVRRAGPQNAVRLKITGVIQAGDLKSRRLKKGETCRIMTGAYIAKGGDAVLPKEWARVQGQELIMEDPMIKGLNVRYEGKEIRKGQRVFKRGSYIHSGTLVTLASLGRSRVKVFAKPKIAAITTGNELVPVGAPLRLGQIYDSNSLMIESLCSQSGFGLSFKRSVKDRRFEIDRVLKVALRAADIVVFLGGVSVGDYDYVKDVLKNNHVRQIFWKVDQKPGKPLYFGRRGSKLIFGLPGNPSSAYMCFYEYVYPAACRMMGRRDEPLSPVWAKLSHDVQVKGRRTHFLKARVFGDKEAPCVEILGKQGSHMVTSLHHANAIALIRSRGARYSKGEKIRVHLIQGVLDGRSVR